MELQSYFQGLLQNIEPSDEAVEHAEESHNEVRTLLEKDEEIKDANPDTFLSGSYARDTAINDINDVDIILLIDIDVSNTLPDTVIAWLHQILQKHYDKTRAQGRSVKVTTDSNFELDIVPGTALSSRDGPLWIPDREAHEWVKTHPKGQIKFGVEKNQATDGYYKDLVKIMKHWKDRIQNSTARPNSYIIETLVAESMHKKPISYGQAVVNFYKHVYSTYAKYLSINEVPFIQDPGYPPTNVAKRWEFEEFNAFMKVVKSAWNTAAAALAETDDEHSVSLWRKLFGDKFRQKLVNGE